MTTAVANNTSASVSASSNAFEKLNVAKAKASDTQNTQDRFLKLLITQLKNQDPMNPTDSAQTTSQMAQISTASGIENLNSSISSMMNSFTAGQSLQATGLIGHAVLAKGGKGDFDGESPLKGAVQVPDGGGVVTVTVTDASGHTVRQLDLGPAKAGRLQVSWDGIDADGNAMPAGKYAFSASVKDKDGADVQADAYGYVRVDSISIGSDGTKVRLVDGSDVAMTDISQIH